jgi:L-lactate dehydrogenase complex protein LldG
MVQQKQEIKMTSRDKILTAVMLNQPGSVPLPELDFPEEDSNNLTEKFTTTLTGIGGTIHTINSHEEIKAHISKTVNPNTRIITNITALDSIAEVLTGHPGSLQDVELAIIKAHFGVAENGAVWITEDAVNGHRVLPFICQHLAVVLRAEDIVADMHKAYDKIGDEAYGFGTFIAGPSKTADIEQSLVLGAHGARSMTVFLMKEKEEV